MLSVNPTSFRYLHDKDILIVHEVKEIDDEVHFDSP